MEKKSLQQVVSGKLDSGMQITEVRILTLHTHTNLKWLKNLNIRHDTIKLPKENTGKSLLDINCISIFYGQYS